MVGIVRETAPGGHVSTNLRQCLDKTSRSLYRLAVCSALFGVLVYLSIVYWFPRQGNSQLAPLYHHHKQPRQQHYKGASHIPPPSPAHSPLPVFALEGRLGCTPLQWPLPLNIEPLHFSSAERTVARVVNERRSVAVGDSVTLRVEMMDGTGRPKGYGCDFLLARVYNMALGNAATGQVTDHDNGTYSVEFMFWWAGESRLEVKVVHHSEAVGVLERARDFVTDKVSFRGNFVSGKVKRTTTCHFVLDATTTTSKAVCSYDDDLLGERWACERPDNMSCDSMQYHSSYDKKPRIFADERKELFPGEQFLPMDIVYQVQEASGSGNVTDMSSSMSSSSRRCVPGLGNPRPNGHYIHNAWRSSICDNRNFVTAQEVRSCLQSKDVYLLGDSTIRQWWDYLRKFIPDTKSSGVLTRGKNQLRMALNTDMNTTLHYYCHGYPVLTQYTFTKDVEYVSKRIDAIEGGGGGGGGGEGGRRVVVAISLGAHFVPFPLAIFRRRLLNIRAALQRLHARIPEATVVVKLANTRETAHNIELYSNWNTFRFNDVTLEAFGDLRVAFVDAWDMTAAIGMRMVHPTGWVVKNEVDMFLSYVC
ncbi:NXPE family member 4-like [Lampetra fluviatilis]